MFKKRFLIMLLVLLGLGTLGTVSALTVNYLITQEEMRLELGKKIELKIESLNELDETKGKDLVPFSEKILSNQTVVKKYKLSYDINSDLDFIIEITIDNVFFEVKNITIDEDSILFEISFVSDITEEQYENINSKIVLTLEATEK